MVPEIRGEIKFWTASFELFMNEVLYFRASSSSVNPYEEGKGMGCGDD